MKRILSLLISLLFILPSFACIPVSRQEAGVSPLSADSIPSSPAKASAVPSQTDSPVSRSFVDSLGRQVELPYRIDRVALSGSLSQIVVFALCPDKLVGLASKWDKSVETFFDPKYYQLPHIGSFYGGKGNMNPETLMASGAQLVIDVGEPKKDMARELDGLQQQTGIPFVHIDAYTDRMGQCYRELGRLLSMEEEAEVLADYCETTYAHLLSLLSQVEKVELLYVLGEGQHVIAQGAYHGEIIDLLGNNPAQLDTPSSKGSGNEVSMEQILMWDPAYVVFAADCPMYEKAATDPVWREVKAIKEGHYYRSPFGPYNWMGFPPSVQRYLGMLWLFEKLYPQAADYDLYDEVQQYFKLFYHCDLSQEQFRKLVEP